MICPEKKQGTSINVVSGDSLESLNHAICKLFIIVNLCC